MHEGSGCGILGSTTVSLERFVVWVYLGSGGELWGERRYPWAAVPEILDIRKGTFCFFLLFRMIPNRYHRI